MQVHVAVAQMFNHFNIRTLLQILNQISMVDFEARENKNHNGSKAILVAVFVYRTEMLFPEFHPIS
jgi:hypothetical protein